MKKWEACHHLGVLKQELERKLSRIRERQKRTDGAVADEKAAREIAATNHWEQEEAVKLEAQLKALDVAGDALTKGR